MTVFVAVELFQGVICSVQVFLMPESAKEAEKRWLEEHGIKDDIDREAKSNSGTELIVEECELKP